MTNEPSGPYFHGLIAQPNCAACPLQYDIKVLPDGPVPAKIAFVGEEPGCLLPDQFVDFAGTPRVISEPRLLPSNATQSHCGWYTGKALRISALGIPLHVTEKHEIKVRRGTRSVTNHSRRALGKEEWLPANAIKKDMYLVIKKSAFALTEDVVPHASVSLRHFEVERKVDKGRVPDELPITRELAIAFGLFLGDGSAGDPKQGTVTWHLSTGYKAKYVPLLKAWLNSINLEASETRRGKRINITAYSTKLARLFSSAFYSAPPGARGHGEAKRIPEFVFFWSDAGVNDFIFGWHEADGKHVKCLTKPHAISSVSRQAIYQGLWLFLRLGIVPTLYADPPRGKAKQVCYDLRFGNALVQRLGWPIPVHTKKQRVLYSEDKDNFYVPVTKIKESYYSGLVYDWTTYSHEYNTPFVVHNSGEKVIGKGFVGQSGQLLWMLCEQAGFKREDVWVTNASLCSARHVRLSNGLIKPKMRVKAEAATACRERLIKELLIVNPQVIVPLGNWALWALSDIPEAHIYSYRGSRIDTDLHTLLARVQSGLSRTPMRAVKDGL